ncbi:MAG TPA: hypothetical protein VKA84_14310 [Gemmatimonadaceae bacterium]|nr:hypothetical protein [Gemmatimonadaceae bacterium]
MPSRLPRSAAPALAALAALTLGACEQWDFTGLSPGGGHLTSVAVGPMHGVVEVGDTLRMGAAGSVDGLLGLLFYDRLLDAAWSSRDSGTVRLVPVPPPPPTDSESVAQVLVRGVSPGLATVTATARGISGSATVRVIPPVARIEVRVTRDTVAVGDTLIVGAIGWDAEGGHIAGLPLQIELAGSIRALGFIGENTPVVAVAPGEGTITASFRGRVGEGRVVVRAAPRD